MNTQGIRPTPRPRSTIDSAPVRIVYRGILPTGAYQTAGELDAAVNALESLLARATHT